MAPPWDAAMSDKTGNSELFIVLTKLTQGTVKGIDESYLDNLLSAISCDLDSQKVSYVQLTNWLNGITTKWVELARDTTLANFLIMLCGVLAKEEKSFLSLRDSGCIETVMHSSQLKHKSSSIRCSYLKAANRWTNHEYGVAKLRELDMWKAATQLYFSDPSLYVRREAMQFLKLMFAVERDNFSLSKKMLHEVLEPALVILQEKTDSISEDLADKAITPSLHLVDGLLDDLVTNCNANAVGRLLNEDYKFGDLLHTFISSSSKESFTDTLITTYCTLTLTSLPDEGPGEIPEVFALYHSLLASNRTCAFQTLSRVGHKLWLRMRVRRPHADDRIEMHFLMMQFMPLMASFRKSVKRQIGQHMDHFVNKLVDQLTDETFRMCYTARDVISDDTPERVAREASKALHGLMDIRHLMNREKVVIAFQSLSWILKNFVPATCDVDEVEDAELQAACQLCETSAPLLHSVLHALSTLIEEYHFVWSEAFEGLFFPKLCFWLLKTPLSVKGLVLTLKLTKLCIQECMPPSLVLLMDSIEGTTLEAVVPLLVRQMQSRDWEVRDSSLEVIAVVADLARDKYPVFQDVLLDLGCVSLAVGMVTGDAERYVRASAIRTVCTMVSVDKLWNSCLVNLDINKTIKKVIRNDTEGIVRKEAALLITELLRWHRIQSPDIDELYETMLSVVLNDLHWEVRENALQFWAEVIELELQEEAMMDGVFPPVTFSKTLKKIVNLTPTEIQTRLLRIMDKLSRIGCLNALLSALLEDFDEEVTVAAGKIVKKLMDLLSLHHLTSTGTAVPTKRRHSPDLRPARPSYVAENLSETSISSEDVLNSIVNSTDMRLLSNVVTASADEPTASEENKPITGGAGVKQPITIVTADVFLARVQEMDLAGHRAADATADLAALLEFVLSLDRETDHVPDCY